MLKVTGCSVLPCTSVVCVVCVINSGAKFTAVCDRSSLGVALAGVLLGEDDEEKKEKGEMMFLLFSCFIIE